MRTDDGGGAKTPSRAIRAGRCPAHPRRGPHGDPLPLPPPRARTVVARARRSDRA